MSSYNNQGRQTELVKSALVNYIKDNQLVSGDHIPTQAELRQMLGVGNAVIGRAVKALSDDGILQSCGRHGVVVLNPSADGYSGRNIGIICHRDTEYAVSAALLQSLGIILNERACQITLFNKNDSERKDCFSLDEFRGACKAVERKQISGLFSTMRLDDASVEFCNTHHIPLVYVGIAAPNASNICFKVNMEECFRYILRKGYHRPMYIHMGHPETEQQRKEFFRLIHKYSLPIRNDQETYCRFIRKNSKSSWDLEENMNKVLQLIREVEQWSIAKRPDVLIIPDDMIATWTAQVTAPESWNVEIIHNEIRQLGYSWPLRARGSYFSIDCHEIAKVAVDSLLSFIQGRKLPREIICKPQFIERPAPGISSREKNGIPR